MSTISVRLGVDLRARVAAAEARTGKNVHAFILDTIAETVEQTELDEEFHCVADARWAELKATGKTVPWEDAKAWLEARARGKFPPRPAAGKLRR